MSVKGGERPCSAVCGRRGVEVEGITVFLRRDDGMRYTWWYSTVGLMTMDLRGEIGIVMVEVESVII